jgi:fructokinase
LSALLFLKTFSPFFLMSNAICLGEVLFDLITDRPGATVEEVQSWTALPGGAPANVACGLVKLGDRSRFIGCIGRDEAGKQLQAKLESESVDLRGLQVHPTAPTRQVHVLRNAEGDRSFGGFGGLDTLSFADAQLDRVPAELFMDANFLVMGTLALAAPASRDSSWQAIKLAQENQVAIAIDVNWRPTFWPELDVDPRNDANLAAVREFLRAADFVKLAWEEAELLYGEMNLELLRVELPQAQGIVVTDGDRDCHYYLLGEYGTQAAFRVRAVDTTGAGDAFVAGLVHQLGLDPRPGVAEMVRYAAAAGALTTLKVGAIDSQPTNAEVMEFLRIY